MWTRSVDVELLKADMGQLKAYLEQLEADVSGPPYVMHRFSRHEFSAAVRQTGFNGQCAACLPLARQSKLAGNQADGPYIAACCTAECVAHKVVGFRFQF